MIIDTSTRRLAGRPTPAGGYNPIDRYKTTRHHATFCRTTLADPDPNPAPCFDERGRLIAPRFDDVYFSADDGLAETRHVFLEGNRLAARLAALRPGQTFTIGETGFGTGLNFLAAWQAFDQAAPADTRLHFLSVERWPLPTALMRQALSPWPQLQPLAEQLLAQWGPLWPGINRFRFEGGRVRLTVLMGEAAEVLSRAEAGVDAWFLDGFSPAKNPAMWSEAVFEQVARLSGPGATLATYTAAGFVRRGLARVGFTVEKAGGFGTKREMVVGRLESATGASAAGPSWGHEVIVIGAGVAGAFAARALAEAGCTVRVIERQQLVNGELPSLSPRIAVVQPKISDSEDPAGAWIREGFGMVQRILRSGLAEDARVAWSACGTFHAAIDERRERRLSKFVQQFGEAGHVRWVDAERTEHEVGIALPAGGVLIESAGILRPAGLVAALLDHTRIAVIDGQFVESIDKHSDRWTARLANGESHRADHLVIANALDAQRFAPTQKLDLRPIRGQATLISAVGPLAWLKRALFYGGYLTPALNDRQMLGASFVPGDTDLAWRDEEHQRVCDQLSKLLPAEAAALQRLDQPAGWVGQRVATPTHRPYAQEIEPGLWVTLGHGSYGIASAAQAADQIRAILCNEPRQRTDA